MMIVRHGITPGTGGRPRISTVVERGDTVYVCGCWLTVSGRAVSSWPASLVEETATVYHRHTSRLADMDVSETAAR